MQTCHVFFTGDEPCFVAYPTFAEAERHRVTWATEPRFLRPPSVPFILGGKHRRGHRTIWVCEDTRWKTANGSFYLWVFRTRGEARACRKSNPEKFGVPQRATFPYPS